MKRLIYIFTLTLVLVSCGSRSGYFSFEGRLLNLNQGEFYVYSPDGVFNGVDTIKVEGGRFTFETPCKENGTIVIIFPNFSEQPVFAEPGKSATIKGDASHLKEIEIDGTNENKLMNGFRQQIAKASPPEVTKYAEQFIRNNPESLASVYILRKYFIMLDGADVEKIEQLANVIHKAQPQNGNIARILRYTKAAKQCAIGAKLPAFKAKDIYDKAVSEGDLRGKVAVVYTWADWNYESRNLRDRLSRMKNEYGDRLAVLGISLEASKHRCRQMLRNDSTGVITVCDQMMFESPLLEQFSFGSVGENVLFNAQGRVVERDLKPNDIESKLEVLLN